MSPNKCNEEPSRLNLTDRALTRAEANELPHGHMFTILPWHRKYALALLVNPTEFPNLIVAAEQAILDRYLEILVTKADTEEFEDLGNATEALSQIREYDLLRYVNSGFLT